MTTDHSSPQTPEGPGVRTAIVVTTSSSQTHQVAYTVFERTPPKDPVDPEASAREARNAVREARRAARVRAREGAWILLPWVLAVVLMTPSLVVLSQQVWSWLLGVV